MSNEGGLATFVLGLAAVVLGTSVVASTVTGASCYYAGKRQRYEDAKPKRVYVQGITVDKKEQQMIVVENDRAEKFGFLREPDGNYKSIDQQLKELAEEQRRAYDNIRNKME